MAFLTSISDWSAFPELVLSKSLYGVTTPFSLQLADWLVNGQVVDYDILLFSSYAIYTECYILLDDDDDDDAVNTMDYDSRRSSATFLAAFDHR